MGNVNTPTGGSIDQQLAELDRSLSEMARTHQRPPPPKTCTTISDVKLTPVNGSKR